MLIESIIDISLSIVYIYIAVMLGLRYLKKKEVLYALLGLAFFVDAFIFTSFDVAKLGINKVAYDVLQMLISYFVAVVLAIVLTILHYREKKGN